MTRRINVLVLALLVLLGGGLLLAALPRVRDAAARMSCHNNLKQIGLALANYHSTFEAFPATTISNDHLPPESRLSWLVDMMPYLDQLRPIIDRAQAWDEEGNREDRCRYRDQNDHVKEEPL